MKIVFGQGNPERKYNNTRHNTGFMVLEALANEYGAVWKVNEQIHARYAEAMIAGEKIILIQPLTFYNETGRVARAYTDYYKLDPTTQFLAIHDDLALPFGTIRVRNKGSDAGNNGIKSLNKYLGADYHRIRIGIWTDERDRMDDTNFVLGTFNRKEVKKLKKSIIPEVNNLVEAFARGTLDAQSAKITD